MNYNDNNKNNFYCVIFCYCLLLFLLWYNVFNCVWIYDICVFTYKHTSNNNNFSKQKKGSFAIFIIIVVIFNNCSFKLFSFNFYLFEFDDDDEHYY